MWQKAAGPRSGAVDTVIGPQCVMRGRLEGCGIVRVEGRFEGEIATEGDVIVGEAGELVANVRARDILVGGLIRGDVHAAGKLEILTTGRLAGDINARQLVIAEGAVFTGRCETVEAIGPDSPSVVAHVVPEPAPPMPAPPAPSKAREGQAGSEGARGEELRSRLRAVSAMAARVEP